MNGDVQTWRGQGETWGGGRGGRVRDEEETRQKFSVMSVEEGTGGVVEERLFSGRQRGEWGGGVRTYFYQCKERHLSKGATRVSLLMCACD